jgi:hypothetical protein
MDERTILMLRALGLFLTCGFAGGTACAGPLSEDQTSMVLRWEGPAQVAGARIDDAVPVIVAMMRRDDVDGVPGLSRNDAALRVQMDGAGRGLKSFQQVLASDLDGNLEVSRAEAEAVARIAASQPLRSAAGLMLPDPDQREALTRGQADLVMQADTDGDGLISEIELKVLAAGPPEDADAVEKRIAAQEAAQVLLWADSNGDANASPEEIATGVRAVLDVVDSDDDGQISRQELAALK